jgi:hypothetical protein
MIFWQVSIRFLSRLRITTLSGAIFCCGSRGVAAANGRDRLGVRRACPHWLGPGFAYRAEHHELGIDQRRAAEHDQASTAAYISGLQDYGWKSDVDSVNSPALPRLHLTRELGLQWK